jgi:hypothetical protein
MDHNARIYDNARRNSDMAGDLFPDDDLLDQEYPPEGLMSEDDNPVTGRYSTSLDYEKVVVGSPKYGSPSSYRSRSSVRLIEKKATSNIRKGSTTSSVEERARSPSLRRLSSANIKAEERPRSPSLGRRFSSSLQNFIRPKTPSSPRPMSPRPKSPVKAPTVSAAETQAESRDELIKLHRQSIKESTDYSKQESKILVNLTMKMGKQLLENPEGASLVNDAFIKYVDELEGILERKMEGMIQLRNYISKLKKI